MQCGNSHISIDINHNILIYLERSYTPILATQNLSVETPGFLLMALPFMHWMTPGKPFNRHCLSLMLLKKKITARVLESKKTLNIRWPHIMWVRLGNMRDKLMFLKLGCWGLKRKINYYSPKADHAHLLPLLNQGDPVSYSMCVMIPSTHFLKL